MKYIVNIKLTGMYSKYTVFCICVVVQWDWI